jgi:hypothetical protein
MYEILLGLLPLIIASSLLPFQIILILLLLQQTQGVNKALSFVMGANVTRLIQGVIFGIILYPATHSDAQGLVKSTLLLILGILLLIAAYKKAVAEQNKEAKPQLLNNITSMGIRQLFLTGMLVPLMSAKLWVFTLSALSVIDTMVVTLNQGLISYTFFLFFSQIFLLLPIVTMIFFPEHAKRRVNQFSVFIEEHNKLITTGASLLFGLLFLYQGITGLWIH